jgi:hypothetical protein
VRFCATFERFSLLKGDEGSFRSRALKPLKSWKALNQSRARLP